MIRKILPIVAIIAIANGLFAQNSERIAEAREKIQKWVETRQVISKERSDWTIQKDYLLSSKALLDEGLVSIQEQLAALEGEGTVADTARTKLTEEKDALDAATGSVKSKIGTLEVQLRGIIKYFPEVFKKQIEPLIRRMPEDPMNPGRTTISERLMNILGIVQQANKFNGTPQLYPETAQFGGEEIQVDVLYWGMGIAFFVDQKGQYAGYKYPTADGWKNMEMDEYAAKIRELIDMYQRKSPEILFVEVPVAIN